MNWFVQNLGAINPSLGTLHGFTLGTFLVVCTLSFVFLCGYVVQGTRVTEGHKYNRVMKRYLLWVAAVAFAFSAFALTLVFHGQQLEDERLISQDQDTIDGCWQEAKGTNFAPAQVQRTIEACLKLEEVYLYNWGVSPLPQTTGV